MRRTEPQGSGAIGYSAGHNGLNSTQVILRRWTLTDVVMPSLDFSRLLAGGQVHATVPGTLPPSRARDARPAGDWGPEPRVGFVEEVDATGHCRAEQYPYPDNTCFRGMPGEEIGDETPGDLCLRYQAIR